ncbi:hypothetical protein PMI01_01460 [Caulobacter sp. AP07]|nr:hypothetical protein PMI01_01460 [Caulobacter sp. AP07]
MSKSRMRWAAGLTLAAGLVASPAQAAKPMTAHVKSGGTYDAIVADYGTCNKAFVDPTSRPPNVPLPQTSVAAQAGASLAVGMMQGYAKEKARQAYVDDCMGALGYSKIDLTPAETTGLKQAKGDVGKKAWFDAFLAQDFSVRIAQVQALTPPLPPSEPQPYGVGGVRLDPASLKAATGLAQADGVNNIVLTATAAHLRTATLKTPMDLKLGMGRLVAPAGAVFHLIDYGPGATPVAPRGAAWCGPISLKSMLMKRVGATCFVNVPGGYEMSPSGNLSTWLAGPEGVVRGSLGSIDGAIDLAPSDTDLIGPMTVALRVVGGSETTIALQATAARDGEAVIIWWGLAPINDAGRAVFPLWGHRLTVTRTGESYASVLTADGDGHGLLELPDQGMTLRRP